VAGLAGLAGVGSRTRGGGVGCGVWGVGCGYFNPTNYGVARVRTLPALMLGSAALHLCTFALGLDSPR
jgi:hypothetical protein